MGGGGTPRREEVHPQPVTIAPRTRILTWRRRKQEAFPHSPRIFSARNCALRGSTTEVHLLPAPSMFRITATSSRREGSGSRDAHREDGLEKEVFSLVGPKRYDVALEGPRAPGYIAEAFWPRDRILRMPDESAARALRWPQDPQEAVRISRARTAGEDRRWPGGPCENTRGGRSAALIIGQYLTHLKEIPRASKAPMHPNGATPNQEREVLYDRFRRGKLPVLVVSKVATSPWTCPTRASPSQLYGNTFEGPARRERRGWAASCAPRTGARTFTRS